MHAKIVFLVMAIGLAPTAVNGGELRAELPYWFERTDWFAIFDGAGDPITRPDGSLVVITNSTGVIQDFGELVVDFGEEPGAPIRGVRLEGDYSGSLGGVRSGEFDWAVALSGGLAVSDNGGDPYLGETFRGEWSLRGDQPVEPGSWIEEGVSDLTDAVVTWEDAATGDELGDARTARLNIEAERPNGYTLVSSLDPIRGTYELSAPDQLSGSTVEVYVYGHLRPLQRQLPGDLYHDGRLTNLDEDLGRTAQDDPTTTFDDLVYPLAEYFDAAGVDGDFRRFRLIPEPSTAMLVALAVTAGLFARNGIA